jgi:hypothetical protein
VNVLWLTASIVGRWVRVLAAGVNNGTFPFRRLEGPAPHVRRTPHATRGTPYATRQLSCFPAFPVRAPRLDAARMPPE